MNKFLRKTALSLLSVFTISLSTHLYATQVIDFGDNLQSFSVNKYNDLPCVEEANNKLVKDKNFESFLLATQELVYEHNLQSFFGIRLLHNHTKLDEGTRMVETLVGDNENVRFVTKPYSESSTDMVSPTSWISSSSGYLPFEYSNELESIALSSELLKSSNFMKGFHTILENYNMSSLFGPAIIAPSKLKYQSDDIGLVEETFIEPFQSIISFQNINNFTSEELITTFWMFDAPIQHGCLMRCRQGVKCKTNPRDGTHFRYSGHDPFHMRY